MSVTLDFDAKDFERGLTDLERKQLPYATMLAVNATAQDVLDRVRERMDQVFDRPTRFTKNAFQILPRATKTVPAAVVGERPSMTSKHYLKVEEAGGPRGQTGFEKLLANVLPGMVRTIIPATGGVFEAAKLDASGNWSTGERNQVLSALGAQRDKASNSTERSRKRNAKRARYFVPKHGLAPGVYRRMASDDIPVRVLKFSDKVPTYRPRLGFLDEAEQVFAARIAENMRRALETAIGSAR